MSYFVFRNMTIEHFFTPVAKILEIEFAYSGYEEVAEFPINADTYIWCYLAPYKAELIQAAAEIENYASMLVLILQRIPTTKTVIAFTMTSIFEVNGLTSKNSQKTAIDYYNQALYSLAEQYKNLRVIDFSTFTSSYASCELIDWKYYFISQMPLNPRLSKAFGVWFVKQVKAIELNRKKCLVLDLDNTLWGGVVGEEGVQGIKIGGDYPGNAYQYFQRYILELQKQGVILTVCSKNNFKDIEQVWKENPCNLIKKENLACFRINWQDKATNIREIANELNIGLDSIVFIDDNPSERELVKGMLPEVLVPEFPEQAYELPIFMQKITKDYFQTYKLTKEDTLKTEQYQANALRSKIQATFANMEDYLKSLEICLDIQEVQPATIERIAQMTQKTNQFNLTTQRYTQSDIEQLMVQGAKIWTLSVKDKFGDSGITGVLIAKIKKDKAYIDTLLLSCRILGKGIEVEFVNYILNLLANKGVKYVFGDYIPTLKNGQVADFYHRMHFILQAENKFIKQIYQGEYAQNTIYSIV